MKTEALQDSFEESFIFSCCKVNVAESQVLTLYCKISNTIVPCLLGMTLYTLLGYVKSSVGKELSHEMWNVDICKDIDGLKILNFQIP